VPDIWVTGQLAQTLIVCTHRHAPDRFLYVNG